MNNVVNDKFGTPITPGCWIVYGHALGRCAGLRVGRVVSVKNRIVVVPETMIPEKFKKVFKS